VPVLGGGEVLLEHRHEREAAVAVGAEQVGEPGLEGWRVVLGDGRSASVVASVPTSSRPADRIVVEVVVVSVMPLSA
jgi:hypothetical protein